jgi:hypothetical protein
LSCYGGQHTLILVEENLKMWGLKISPFKMFVLNFVLAKPETVHCASNKRGKDQA